MLQIHYILSLGAEINQRDDKGFTPLHRAAYLAQYDGYMEIYEYLLVRITSGPKALGEAQDVTCVLVFLRHACFWSKARMTPVMTRVLSQTRGADPSVRTNNYDPYLSPGLKLPIEVALDDEELRGKLKALDKKYAKASRTCPELHPLMLMSKLAHTALASPQT